MIAASNKYRIIYLSAFLMMTGCSVRKYLPAGETLYKGASFTVRAMPGVKIKRGKIKTELKVAARPVANKFILGQPYKVWWWYKIGEPKKEKSFKAWIRSKLGEPPVYSSRLNTVSNAQDMESVLENDGYFRSTVIGDSTIKKEAITAHYTVNVSHQYTIKNFTWVSDSSKLMLKLDSLTRTKKGLIKVGDPSSLRHIQNERSRLDLKL